ncbi:unnamed protein product, partial [Mesorhabditis belari]|uniref:C-type lectin domain-containing protein n=1 Tax=Mesorhabditis belari TaxID=2138241 RepID=A0AAF3FLB7_9BILA
MFFLSFLLFPFLSADDPICPKYFFYQSDLNLCIVRLNSQADWKTAEFLCSGEFGGHLPSIHNAFQNSLFAELQMNLTGNFLNYLGAKQISNGVFNWSDGSVFDYQKLQHSSEAGDCVLLDSRDQMWKLTPCSRNLTYLCAAQPVASTTTLQPITQSTSRTLSSTAAQITTAMNNLTCLPANRQPLYNCAKGWQYFSDHYYMVLFDMTYDDGETACRSYGSHLASIHSSAENDFITKLCCESACDDTDHNGLFAGIYLTGGTFSNGVLTWTDGSQSDYQHQKCFGDPYALNQLVIIENTNLCDGDRCARGDWGLTTLNDEDEWPYIVCKRS